MVRRDTPSVSDDTIINRIKNPRRQSAGGDFIFRVGATICRLCYQKNPARSSYCTSCGSG